MPASSRTPLEKSRKAYSALVRSLEQPGKQGGIAIAMQVSDSTVSRIKTEKTEDALSLLYHAGFKCVPADFVCVDRAVYEAVATLAQKAMQQPDIARKLTWDDE